MDSITRLIDISFEVLSEIELASSDTNCRNLYFSISVSGFWDRLITARTSTVHIEIRVAFIRLPPVLRKNTTPTSTGSDRGESGSQRGTKRAYSFKLEENEDEVRSWL